VDAVGIALLLYVAWLHRKLYQLLLWLRDSKNHEAPEPRGVFEELAVEIDYLRERHKKRKKKLANYLKQFQQATRALPDATVVLDEDGAVQWANAAAGRYLGIRWPEDTNQRITNLIRMPRLQEFVQEHEQATTIEIPSPTEQNRFLSVLLAPYGKDQWLFVARDVTQLHRLSQIRSDFVANVSHELRTPLTLIRAMAETLEDQPSDEVLSRYLRKIIEEVDRLSLISQDLLILSAAESNPVRKQSCEIAEVFRSVVAQLNQKATEKGLTLEYQGPSSLLTEANQSQLTQVAINLVDNAINYTTTGRVTVILSGDASCVEVSVRDTGIGIPSDHLPRIFERFYRVEGQKSGDRSGTGLGLAIVKHIMNRHRGGMTVESVEGEGATFAIYLPMAKASRP
jgi:two-component system phosphate regulon sensor histidine kinase PhoR